jgi:hypothetical protein
MDDVAPIYKVTPREVVAVEHPMIIQNIDNALKTFGKGRPFDRVSSIRSHVLSLLPLSPDIPGTAPVQFRCIRLT